MKKIAVIGGGRIGKEYIKCAKRNNDKNIDWITKESKQIFLDINSKPINTFEFNPKIYDKIIDDC